jgi:hypothetical protein
MSCTVTEKVALAQLLLRKGEMAEVKRPQVT